MVDHVAHLLENRPCTLNNFEVDLPLRRLFPAGPVSLQSTELSRRLVRSPMARLQGYPHRALGWRPVGGRRGIWIAARPPTPVGSSAGCGRSDHIPGRTLRLCHFGEHRFCRLFGYRDQRSRGQRLRPPELGRVVEEGRRPVELQFWPARGTPRTPPRPRPHKQARLISHAPPTKWLAGGGRSSSEPLPRDDACYTPAADNATKSGGAAPDSCGALPSVETARGTARWNSDPCGCTRGSRG